MNWKDTLVICACIAGYLLVIAGFIWLIWLAFAGIGGFALDLIREIKA